MGEREKLYELVDQLADDELSEVRRILAARAKASRGSVNAGPYQAVAGKYYGCVDSGLTDLGSNPDHLNGYGK